MEETRAFPQEAVRLLICAVIGLTVTLFLIFLASLLISSGAIREDAGLAVAVGLCALGAVVGGFIAGRRSKKRAILGGLVSGTLALLLLLLFGAVFFRALAPTGGFIPIALACVGGGVGGAVLSAAVKRR